MGPRERGVSEAVEDVRFTNRALLLPYLLPYLLYTGIASLPQAWLGPELNYGARLVATAAALVWFWRRYVPLRGPHAPLPSVLIGAAVGLVGTGLWIALLHPFVERGGEAWSATAFWLRTLCAGVVVPLFEEWLMRGYILRLAVQWVRARRAGASDPFDHAFSRSSINEVEPGAWTPLAVVISTVLFTLGHTSHEWPAAATYGLLMAGLWILRKDLLSCVAAHAATNISLAFHVRATGHWALW